MKSLDLIIEASLAPQLHAQATTPQSICIDNEKHVRMLKFLREYHELQFGQLNDMEIKSLNEQMPMGNPNLGPAEAPHFNAKNKQRVLNILKSSEKVKKDFLSHAYNFTKTAAQSEILNYIKTGKFDKSTKFNKWKNTTDDNFFKQIVEQDPLYGKATTGGKLHAGYVFDRSNPGNQWYDYEILCTDSKGKSIAWMRFSPDGIVKIMPDVMASSMDTFTYKITGTKISIYSTIEPTVPILTGVQNDYTLMFTFNDDFLKKDYDPYKGAGWLRLLWLDITGVKRKHETKWKNQKEYDSSGDSVLDTIQSVADWAGLIPGYGDVIDILNGLVYWIRGKKLEALLSMIAIIPVVGSIMKNGFKLAFKSFKIGGKTGMEALEALFVKGPKAWTKEARKTLIEYLARNKVARQQMQSVAHAAVGAVRSAVRRLVDIAKNLRGKAVVGWVGRVLDDLVAKYGKPLEDYARNFAKSTDELVQNLDTASDLVVVGSKGTAEVAGYVGKKGIREVLKGLSAELSKNAGFVMRAFYRIVGKKWFDAFQRSMIDSFVQYVKQGGPIQATQKFFTTLVGTQGGSQIIFDAAFAYFRENPRLLTEWLLERPAIFKKYFPTLFNRFGNQTIEQIGEGGMRNILAEFAIVLRNSLSTGLQFRRTFNDLVLMPLARNVDALNKFLDDVIIDCIQKGNALYKMWAMSFWNNIRAAMPNRIHNFFEARNIIGRIKYNFGGGSIYDLEGTVGKWVQEAFQKSPLINRYIGGLVRGFLSTLQSILNLKRLDVFYNEFRDFFEKIGVDSDNVDENQGVIASVIANILEYFFGIAPFRWIKEAIGFGSEIINPGDMGQFKAVPEIPMVKQQKFKTPLEK